MSDVNTKQSKGTKKASFKASVDRREDKLISAIDRKKKPVSSKFKPLRGNIRVWRRTENEN